MRDRFLRPTFTILVSAIILLGLLGLSISSSTVQAAPFSAIFLDAGVDITVTSNDFTPNSFTIATGQDVTWQNEQGFHNVVADDGSFTNGAASSDNWTFTHTFNTAGTYQYYCEIHGGPGGSGMSGVIIVEEGPTATPIPTDTPTNTAVPATNTPTNTAVPATNTPTNTAVPATNTPTNTAVPATNTPTSTAVAATPTLTPTTEPATALTYTNISVSRSSRLPTLAFLLLGSVLLVVFRMRRR